MRGDTPDAPARARPSKGPPIATFASPEGVVVLAAAGATAALATLPIVLVPGVLAYGILTWLRYERWRIEAERSAAFAPVEADLGGLAKPLAARVTRCVEAQRRILVEIEATDPQRRGMLGDSVERVRALARSAETLARKLAELEGHLGRSNRQAFDREAAELGRKAEAARDDEARRSYERALAQQQQKASAFEALAARAERLDAQLTDVELTLDTVAAQVIRIKSAEGESAGEGAAERGRSVVESLDALRIDVDAAVETIDEELGSSHAPGAPRTR